MPERYPPARRARNYSASRAGLRGAGRDEVAEAGQAVDARARRRLDAGRRAAEHEDGARARVEERGGEGRRRADEEIFAAVAVEVRVAEAQAEVVLVVGEEVRLDQ